MEVSNEIKEEIRKTQNDLKNAIRVHQAWVARLKEDQNNVSIKKKIKEAEKDIITIGHTQKKVIGRLRQELEQYQQRLKARNKQINSDYDHRHIAQQLRDYQLQNRTRKKSISLLKPSVLSEIHIKSENNNVNGTAKCEQKFDDLAFIDNEQTNGFKIKEQLDDDEFIRATENFSLKDPAVHNTVQDRRAHFANALNKAKQRICPQELNTSMKRSPSPKSGTPSPGRVDVSPVLDSSPTPSPSPPLPQPGEELSQETFMKLLGLITPKHKQLLEKKRNERKKRSTTSTNKNEYVYGNFDLQTKKRKLNFPYLQQNVAPPTTRAQQRMKRQQQQQQRSGALSPTPSSSTPPESPPPHFLTLPSGLTIVPVVSPEPMPCCVCNQNDVPSLLRNCRGCGSYFHWSCASERTDSPAAAACRKVPPSAQPVCPQCGETVKEPRTTSMTVIGFANKPSEAAIKEKLSEKRLLQERNQQLRSDLKKLEMRAETLKENIEAKNTVKKKLLSEQIETQKNLQKLLEFVGKFKDTTPYNVRRMVKEDSKSSDSN